MNESRRIENYLHEYESYITRVIQPSREELKKYFKIWKQSDFWSKYSETNQKTPDPSPVQRFEIRIKRPESAFDKISRNSVGYPEGPTIKSLQKMKDVLGGRIVVYFVSQLYLIDSELRNSEYLELSTKNPPVAYLDKELLDRFKLSHLRTQQKESGYASVHYYVRLKQTVVPVKERPWIEIQVRTLAEDIWACVEHIIGYKPHKKTNFPVTKQFQILSRQLSAIDEHFNFLFEELSRFQMESKFTNSDPLNPENLPQVIAEIGIRCAQSEIDGLLRLLNSRKLSKVGQLRKAAPKQRKQKILSIYLSEKSRKPSNFEYIAHFANIGTKTVSRSEEERLIRTQMKFLEAWDRLKKGNI